MLSFLIVVGVRKRGKKKQSDTVRDESSFISAADHRASLCLCVCYWRNQAEKRM